MVDNINLDPRAQAAFASPDTARNSVLDAATDIFGVLSTITTKQGEVFSLTLDLDNAEGEDDTDFRSQSFGVQQVTTNNYFDIKQKVYLQTDASRLSELGNLSSKVFQKKYYELSRLLVADLAAGRIDTNYFIAAQEALLKGSSADLDLETLIARYDSRSEYKGYRNLPGVLNEVIETGTVRDKLVRDAKDAIEGAQIIDDKTNSYLQVIKGSLVEKLLSKEITSSEFLAQQREAVDKMLDSSPLESMDTYIQKQKSAIEDLMAGAKKKALDEIATLSSSTRNYDGRNFETDENGTALNKIIQYIINKTITAAVNSYKLSAIASDFNFTEIDDGNDDYGIDTDPNKAARIYDGRVYKSDASSTALQKIISKITNDINEAPDEASANRLQSLIGLNDNEKDALSRLTPTDNFYEAGGIKVQIQPFMDWLLRANPDQALNYRGIGFMADADTIRDFQASATAQYEELSSSDKESLDLLIKNFMESAITYKRQQENFNVVFEDKRTILDVINGDKSLADKSYEELSEYDKLFAGTNKRASSVENTVNNKLNTVNNAWEPILSETGGLQRKIDPLTGDFYPLINDKGEEVSVADLKRDADGNLLTPLKDSQNRKIKLFFNNKPIMELHANTVDKRVNQALALYALEDIAASKQNAEYELSKLPEPKANGEIPTRALPPPPLAPTVTSMIIARLGKEVVERASELKKIEVNTSGIETLKNTVNQFNGALLADMTADLKEELLKLVNGMATISDSDYKAAETDFKIKKDHHSAKENNFNSKKTDFDNKKVDFDRKKADFDAKENEHISAYDDVESLRGKTLSKSKKHTLSSYLSGNQSRNIAALKSHFDDDADIKEYLRNLDDDDVIGDKFTRVIVTYPAMNSSRNNCDQATTVLGAATTDLGLATADLNTATTVLSTATTALTNATNNFKNAIIAKIDTQAGLITGYADKFLRGDSPEDHSALELKLKELENSLQSFSQDLNVFNAGLDATFGPRTSPKGTKIEDKKIQELILLMLIFSTFEASDWDFAQAEADPSRYEVGDG